MYRIYFCYKGSALAVYVLLESLITVALNLFLIVTNAPRFPDLTCQEMFVVETHLISLTICPTLTSATQQVKQVFKL